MDSGKHISCQLHPLCPAPQHSHLSSHSSGLGTVTGIPTHLLRWTSHIKSLNKVQTPGILKGHRDKCVATHRHRHALTAQEAYLSSSVSPPASWQPKTLLYFQGFLYPLSQASSICLVTLSCTSYPLSTSAANIRRADSTARQAGTCRALTLSLRWCH